MKDYSTNDQEKLNYITNFKKVKNSSGMTTYEATFADGKKFKNICCDEENLKKIVEVQESQAEAGIKNTKIFMNKKKKNGILTLAGIVISGMLFDLSQRSQLDNYSTYLLAAGTITFGTTLYEFMKYLKNSGKVMELRKIKYRNDNLDELSKVNEYENALVGLSNNKKKNIKKSKDPFSIIEINKYTKKDLMTIMSNIEREKTYKFSYQKNK